LVELLDTPDVGARELLGGQGPGCHLGLELGNRRLEKRKVVLVLVVGLSCKRREQQRKYENRYWRTRCHRFLLLRGRSPAHRRSWAALADHPCLACEAPSESQA